MTRTYIRGAIAAAAIALLSTRASAQEFKVVANSGVATSEIGAADLARIFLKQSNKYPDGGNATPVDQGKGSPARAAFSQKVLGKSVGAVDTYWQQQIFSGKDVPPATKSSDDDIIAFVKATPGAIGYVSGGAATAGVKLIGVK